ncbi:hypothetical protein B0H12DRAFT_1243450 [Mycena haematopus]|nr:hypothetical protein B0H12DRAFT_1243450 [Mycena haematopus]
MPTGAYAGACYQNKYNSVSQSNLPTYFSTDPIWVNTFGSAAAAAAYVLLDPRLLPSFQQLTSTDEATLVNAITQSVGSGGTSMLQIVMTYLAGQAMLSSTIPLTGVNTVSDVPVTVDSANPSLPPQPSEVTVQTFTTPLMFIGMFGQGILSIIAAAKAQSISIDAIIQGLRTVLANRRAAGFVPLSAEERFSDAQLFLPAALKADLATLQKMTKFTSLQGGAAYFNVAFSGLFAGTMIWQTAGSWNTNMANGAIGKASNALNVVIDVMSTSMFVAGVGGKLSLLDKTRALEAPDTMLSSATKMSNVLKPLEKFTAGAGGLMMIAFGVMNILGGTQELEAGGSQMLNGRLDVSSGALMVTGGALEIAGALGGSLAIPAVGEIIAGIGMEVSTFPPAIIKIWVGGAQSVGAFGQSLLSIFGVDAGMTDLDFTVNYIRHVKGCAVQAKISGLVTSSPPISPDPRDDINDTSVPKNPANGIEAKGSPYIIAPFYSVANLPDTI